jgi:hypothetical protein
VTPVLYRFPTPTIVPDRFIVFLFDDMHLSIGDLAQAQKASTKMLAASDRLSPAT